MEYYIHDEKEVLEQIRRYVEIETPGRDLEQIGIINELMTRELTELGAKVTEVSFPSGNALIAEVGAAETVQHEVQHSVLLLGHRDTVFKKGDLQTNPFRIETDDSGRRVLRGPGVLDMKTGDVMIVEILRHFAKKPIPGWKLTALFTSDEEFGSPDSRNLITKMGKAADFCFVMEPCIEGMCTIIRKGIASYHLTAEGISAHSGVNYTKGASAIQALCWAVNSIYALRDDEKKISINVGSFLAEGKNNVICPKAEVRGEVRCFQNDLLEETIDKIRTICESDPVPGTRIIFEPLGKRPPMERTDEARALHELAKECAAAHGLQLKGRVHGGGSDGAFVQQAGTPVLDGMGAEGDGAHTENERVLADSIMNRIKTSIDVITKMAEK